MEELFRTTGAWTAPAADLRSTDHAIIFNPLILKINYYHLSYSNRIWTVRHSVGKAPVSPSPPNTYGGNLGPTSASSSAITRIPSATWLAPGPSRTTDPDSKSPGCPGPYPCINGKTPKHTIEELLFILIVLIKALFTSY